MHEESSHETDANLENLRTVGDILRDLRHVGLRSGNDEIRSPEITQRLFNELTKAIAKEKTPSGQPPIQPGFARLYRGEPVAGDFPKNYPALKLHALSDQYGESGGRWFDLDESVARQYVGENGAVYYVDVPADSLISYEAINLSIGLPGEFILPESIISGKQALPRAPK